MKYYISPRMHVVFVFIEDGVTVGSASTLAMTFNSNEEVKERWIEEDDVDQEWVW